MTEQKPKLARRTKGQEVTSQASRKRRELANRTAQMVMAQRQTTREMTAIALVDLGLARVESAIIHTIFEAFPGLSWFVIKTRVEFGSEPAMVIERCGGAGLCEAGWEPEDLPGMSVNTLFPGAEGFESLTNAYKQALAGVASSLLGWVCPRTQDTYNIQFFPVPVRGQPTMALSVTQRVR